MINKLASPIKIFLILTGLIFLSYLLINYNQPVKEESFFKGAKNLLEENIVQVDKINEEKAAKINLVIHSNLDGTEGRYAAFIKDLKTNQIIEYKSNENFDSASIYKLALMYKTFDALEKNQVRKNTVLSANSTQLDQVLSSHQNTISSTENQGLVSYTVAEALRLMITISDNYSALLLAEKFGWKNIENFLKVQGIGNFSLAGPNPPQTTATATAQILEKIYQGQAVSKSASRDMKKLLLSQTVNDRIPKYLPQNIKVAHKTGELGTFRHDAGIIYGKKSDYIFVFLSDTPNPEDASETIATLSKQIFLELEDR